MLLPAALFFAAITVRSGQGDLRSGCSPDDPVIATLAEGAAIEVRFALNDGTGCYKVGATSGGQPVQGYLPSTALAGLEEFERERRAAADGGSVHMLSPVQALQNSLSARAGSPVLRRAVDLVNQRKPAEALQLIEPLLNSPVKDRDTLLLAGLAAYRSDQVPRAVGYWRQALDMRPDETLERFYRKLERDAASDSSTQKLYGLRVVLRYDGRSLRPDAAQSLVAILDEEFIRISNQLGCAAEERIVTIVQDRQAYLRGSDAAEWSVGQYDGRIHVALPEAGRIPPDMRRTLAHETVHACLANLPGSWPAWLHEGLAQKLSGDALTPDALVRVRQLAASHALPRLENMSQSWSRMSPQHARDSYAVALAAVDALFENYANYGIRNILNNPGQLAAITADLDHRLGL